MLQENSELLCRIVAEANQRKNKNFMNSQLASMICQLERNLIEVCRCAPPSVMLDYEVGQRQKAIFYRPKKANPPT